jgi:hypothetical protein
MREVSTTSPGASGQRPAARPDAVFVIAAAGAGAPSLAHALATLPVATTLAEEPAPLVDPGVNGDRRTGSGGTAGAIRVRSPWSKHPETALVPIDGAPRRALQIPHLDETFRDARFVFVARPAAEAMAAAYQGWRAGGSVSYPDLDRWPGPPWSFALVPGWRELAGEELAVLVAEQWARVTAIAVDDLRRIDPARVGATSFAALLDDPAAELRRLCRWIGIGESGIARVAEALRAELEAEVGGEGVGAPGIAAVADRGAEAERAAEALRAARALR